MNERPVHQDGATVVLSLRVLPGHEDRYERWQAKIDAAAKEFAGFEGSEVLRPVEGVQDEWVVVYRFDSAGHLSHWMSSETRRALVDSAAEHFEYVREQVVATPRSPARPVTVVVSQTVRPGHEPQYERWQTGITNAAAAFPGFLGGETFGPVAGVQDDWVVVFRFANPQTLQAWLDSDERRAWLDRSRPWVEEVSMQTVGGGLGGWFPISVRGPVAVPSWKQAMTVLIVLYPTVMLLSRVLTPALHGVVPDAVNLFINNVVSVAVLTWLLMPVANRALNSWLRPKDRRAGALGNAVVATLCAAMVALFVALE